MLDLQADRIETVLAAHRAPVRVWGGRLTPRTIQFHLAPGAQTKLSRLEALTEEVALALGTNTARLTRTNGTLSLEVPRPDSRWVSLGELDGRLQADPALRRALGSAGTAILGIDSQGVPLLLRLASPDVAHCLIAGTTGSGKTELARTLVASLVTHQPPRDLQLALFDPKGHGFSMFAGMPHLMFPVISDVQEMAGRLAQIVAEMERREREHAATGIPAVRPRIIVVIDELADVLQTSGSEVENLLTRLVQRGRSAGVSVVACTQKPSARAVGTVLRANFPVRLVGRVTSPDDARVAAGLGGTGAEKLAGRGDFLLIAGGEVIRFQAAQTKVEDLAQVGERSAGPAAPEPGWSARMLGKLRRVK